MPSVRKLTEADWEAALEQVLEEMTEGKTVAQATESLPFVVSPGAVRQRLRGEGYRERYEVAKQALAQALAEEAIQIARDATNHSSPTDRLLIETLKWAAAKANPREYGERQTVEHQGSQVLQVKILEENGEPYPKRIATESAVLAAGTVLSLPATPKPVDYGEGEE